MTTAPKPPPLNNAHNTATEIPSGLIHYANTHALSSDASIELTRFTQSQKKIDTLTQP